MDKDIGIRIGIDIDRCLRAKTSVPPCSCLKDTQNCWLLERFV